MPYQKIFSLENFSLVKEEKGKTQTCLLMSHQKEKLKSIFSLVEIIGL